MSKTFTSRPSVASNRGRGGRGRQVQNTLTNTKQRGGMNPNQSQRGAVGRGRGGPGDRAPSYGQDDYDLHGDGATGGSSQPQQQEDRMERRDAYTVIAPNMQKKQAIEEQARRGTEMYNQYKEQRKAGPMNYVGTVGGGELSQAAARQRAVRQHITSPGVSASNKTAQYKAKQKQEEEKKLDQMKVTQRQKAESNAQKERHRNTSLQSEHRAKNAAFLDRVEREGRRHHTDRVLSTTAAAHYQAPEDPPHQSTAPLTNYTGYEEEDADYSPSYPPGGVTPPSPPPGPRDAAAVRRRPVDTLTREFPGGDPAFIEDLLFQFNGNMDLVRDMLRGT